MPDRNAFVLEGTLADDPEVKLSAAGNPYARFSLVVPYGEGKSNYFPIVAFGDDANKLDEIATQDTRLRVMGHLSRSRPGADKPWRTDLVADTFALVSTQPEPEAKEDGDDDIPF